MPGRETSEEGERVARECGVMSYEERKQSENNVGRRERGRSPVTTPPPPQPPQYIQPMPFSSRSLTRLLPLVNPLPARTLCLFSSRVLAKTAWRLVDRPHTGYSCSCSAENTDRGRFRGCDCPSPYARCNRDPPEIFRQTVSRSVLNHI